MRWGNPVRRSEKETSRRISVVLFTGQGMAVLGLVYGLPTAIAIGTLDTWLKTFLHSDDAIYPLEVSTFDIEWNGESQGFLKVMSDN